MKLARGLDRKKGATGEQDAVVYECDQLRNVQDNRILQKLQMQRMQPLWC